MTIGTVLGVVVVGIMVAAAIVGRRWLEQRMSPRPHTRIRQVRHLGGARRAGRPAGDHRVRTHLPAWYRVMPRHGGDSLPRWVRATRPGKPSSQ